MSKLRDLDKFDDEHERHLSNDGYAKVGLKNLLQAQDPEWREGQAERNRAKRLDSEHVKKHLASVQSEEYRANMSASIKASEAHKEGIKKRSNNSTWLTSIQRITKDPERNKKISQSNKREIQTPYGIFPSMSEASIHMTDIGIGNSYKKLYKLMQTCPDVYFYTDGLGIQKVKPHKRK